MVNIHNVTSRDSSDLTPEKVPISWIEDVGLTSETLGLRMIQLRDEPET